MASSSSSSTATTEQKLPQEMQQHTYQIMADVEEQHWWYVGRRLILTSFVKEIVADLAAEQGVRHAPLRILDVGCGTGGNLAMLSEFGRAEGIDVSEEALALCRARGLRDVRLGAAEQLPYADGEFDVATALDVVEHLDDDIAGLSEMRRVLRKGGRALLFVPAFMFLWGVQDEVSHHRRRYRLGQLQEVVRTAGFEVERATYANITMFVPIALGRAVMRASGVRPASENNINLAAFNPLLGQLFGAERWWLRRANFPFGVSALCVARKKD